VGQDQEAGANKHGRDAAPLAADALARESRAIVIALLDRLRQRVINALMEAGLSEDIAVRAADDAVDVLAASIADGERAARIVQAALERLQSGGGAAGSGLLGLAARGLVIAIDMSSGSVQITPPEIGVRNGAHAGAADPHLLHLLDFTDGEEGTAAPLAAAFAAIRAAAAEFPTARPGPSAPPSGKLAILPDAFGAALSARLAAAAPAMLAARPDLPAEISRVIVRAIAVATPAAQRPAPAEISRAIASLASAPVVQGNAGEIRLESPDLAVTVKPASGAITVRVGQAFVAFAPASLPAIAALPGAAVAPTVDLAPLPINDISPNIPIGKILERPSGIPFVPPEISDLPHNNDRPGPDAPGHRRDHAPLPGHASAIGEAELFSAFEKLRTHTVLRSVESAEAAEAGARLSRFTLDVAAEIGDAMPTAVPADAPGRFGRARTAASAGDPVPPREAGHPDASAMKPPVLPAWHAAGLLPGGVAAPAEPAAPAKRKKRPALPYHQDATDDSFTRELPKDFEGVVYASVFVSV
jgi:hypothetical protein